MRSFEVAGEQLKQMSTPEEVRLLHRKTTVQQAGKQRRQGVTVERSTSEQGGPPRCKFCNRFHPPDRNKCGAWGRTCNNCGLKNHFSVCCKARSSVHGVQDECNADEYVASVETCESTNKVDISDSQNKALATLQLNGKDEKFQLDTGATVNILSEQTFATLFGSDQLNDLQECKSTLVMYNRSEEKPTGKKRVRVINPKNNRGYSVEFIILRGNYRSLLGLRASQQMQLVTLNRQNILAIESSRCKTGNLSKSTITAEFQDLFKGEGRLPGELHLEVDETARPVQLPTRRVPVALKDKLKQELDRLSNMEIIAKVHCPTDWISASVITTKKNGKIRLCIDPKPLNNALKRNVYPLPTIDDVLPLLSKARIFTVLDARNGFWHIQLDETSTYLTTFGTPWGRYRWLRLPFGVSPAPEEFQRRMDIALEGLEGQKAIADDILVFGSGTTDEEAQIDHDKKLLAVLNRCRETGIKLNVEKMQFRQPEVIYMGHVISAEGLKVDPNKVKAIHEMPQPTDKQGVLRVLGMANYVQKFAPNLAETTTPLRDLIKKDNEFVWDDQVHGQCLSEIKQTLTQAPVLKFFDPDLPTVLQCDASQSGLGACLLQQGHPIAYASRSLTPTEAQYAQIEKELLAIVFGMEKFEGYTYGRKVLVDTDHKPLESIMKKGLLSAPKRLQRMLLRLQKFDVEVTYKKGTELYIADTLSRAYLPMTGCESQGDSEDVMLTDIRSPTEIEAEQIDMAQFLPIRDETLQEIKLSSESDADLTALTTLLTQGWPDSKTKVPIQLHGYYTFREELTAQNGLVYKGERVVVPVGARQNVMSKLHASHLGVQGCLGRAREAFYWPGMNKDITEYIAKCSTCNTYKPDQQKEPLICHELPSRPWQSISVDLFDFRGQNYLVTTDRYSNFFEVDRLTRTTSLAVINKLKPHMARYGLPERVTTDNGPQFDSVEFRKFASDYNFDHVTSSPHYPQANGKAENSVKTAKSILQKAFDTGQDPELAFLGFRNTPTEGMGSSPAQRLHSRRTRSLLPLSEGLLQPMVVPNVQDKLVQARTRQAHYYDRNSKELKPLQAGDVVRVKPTTGKKWFKARVDSRVDIRSYNVRTEEGAMYRRNRRHLYKVPESFVPLSEETAADPPGITEPEKGNIDSPDISVSLTSATSQPQPLSTNDQNAEEQQMQQNSTSTSEGGTGSDRHYVTTRGRVVKKPTALKDFET